MIHDSIELRGTLYTLYPLFSISGPAFCCSVPVIKPHCGFVVATMILELLFSALQSQSHNLHYYYNKLHGEVKRMHAVGLDTCVSCTHLEIVLAKQLTSREGLLNF